MGFCSWRGIILVSAASACCEDCDCRSALQGRVLKCSTPQAIFQNTSQRGPRTKQRKQVTARLTSWGREEWKPRGLRPYPPLSFSREKGFSRGMKPPTQKWFAGHKEGVGANAAGKCLSLCGSQYFHTNVFFLDLRRFQWLQSWGKWESEAGPDKQCLDSRQEWVESGTLGLVSSHAEDGMELGLGWWKAGVLKLESFYRWSYNISLTINSVMTNLCDEERRGNKTRGFQIRRVFRY